MNSLKRSYQRNISLSLWLQVFANFGIATLWILYLTQQGMSMVEIGLLESVRQLTSLIFEVPSGVLTDRFSYKPNSSMIYSVSALIVFPAMGWLIDQFGFIHSFIGLGGFMLIGGVVLVIRNKRMSRVIGV